MQQPAQPQRSGAVVGAALLIVIGLGVLVFNLTGSAITGAAIPAFIGLAFLVAYAVTRQYGFLVPGGILAGFGAGVLAAQLMGVTDNGLLVVLGGGLGFLLIYGLDLLVARAATRWWPLIPGGILLVVAGGMATQSEGVLRQVGLWSPLLLIVIGVLLLLARSRPIKH